MSSSNGARRLPRFVRWSVAWKIGAVILVVLIGRWVFGGRDEKGTTGTTFTAVRGPLKITVLEGGSVAALESQDIKSEIKGQTKILTIVDEGYQVTEQDVKDGKVLVTLDNSEILEKLTQQEITYQSALAGYTDAREQYGIQIKQNESDIKTAELAAKFAKADFEKYLGAELATRILKEQNLELPPPEDFEAALAALEDSVLNIEADLDAVMSSLNGAAPAEGDSAPPAEKGADEGSQEKPAVEVNVAGEDAKGPEAKPQAKPGDKALEDEKPPRPSIDFTQYAKSDLLGDGEAQQNLRKYENERLLAEEEKRLAVTNFEATKRLAEKQFVTTSELDKDEIAVKRNEVATESSMTQEELFRKYEFPKMAEKLLSDFEEGLRKLDRVKKEAVSKLAQAKAQFKSTEAQFALQRQRRDELREQLEKCTIRAERTGLVVYAGSDEPWRRQERIEEGATVFERQDIITIPDMTQMGVEVKVHESSIKKVQKGQEATIRIDAYPDEVFNGEVEKVSVLPDSGQRWMNPDLKLYPTKIRIAGTHEGLKPGLSAEAELLVKELTDVVYVPIQAVTDSNGERVCYVAGALGSPERRVVETGDFNDEFIEIKSGLEEGERVLLRAPKTQGPEEEAAAAEKREKQPEDKPKDEGNGGERPQEGK